MIIRLKDLKINFNLFPLAPAFKPGSHDSELSGFSPEYGLPYCHG